MPSRSGVDAAPCVPPVAGLGSERRTVQFVLERICPALGREPLVDIDKTRFPVVLWIYWPKIESGQGVLRSCAGEHYELTPESRVVLQKHFDLPFIAGEVLCEHSGRLIE